MVGCNSHIFSLFTIWWPHHTQLIIGYLLYFWKTSSELLPLSEGVVARTVTRYHGVRRFPMMKHATYGGWGKSSFKRNIQSELGPLSFSIFIFTVDPGVLLCFIVVLWESNPAGVLNIPWQRPRDTNTELFRMRLKICRWWFPSFRGSTYSLKSSLLSFFWNYQMLVAVLMLTGMLYQILREQMGDHLKKKKKKYNNCFCSSPV